MFNRIFILSLVLIISSCAGNKKKVSSNEEDVGTNSQGIALQLNGDSDSNLAGGLKTIYFDYNSAQLSRESRITLDENAEFLKTNISIKIQVEGHTDERGGTQFNLSLGERRAKSVRDYLSAKGISLSRLSVLSLGKERPLLYGHNETSWSKNRRANFVISGK